MTRWNCSRAPLVPFSRTAGEAKIPRARRNGPRISSSAVAASGVKPSAAATSAAATSSRVLPMPGSPSSVSAVSRPALADGELLPDRAELDLSPDDGPRGPSDLKGNRECRRRRRGLRFTHASNLCEWTTSFTCVARGPRTRPELRVPREGEGGRGSRSREGLVKRPWSRFRQLRVRSVRLCRYGRATARRRSTTRGGG